MKYEQWNLRRGAGTAARLQLERAGLPALCAAVLCARGLDTPEKAADFLSDSPDLLHDPFLLKDMDRAVARILCGLERGEVLAVYGDYDCDGVTATVLLYTHLICICFTYRYESGIVRNNLNIFWSNEVFISHGKWR